MSCAVCNRAFTEGTYRESNGVCICEACGDRLLKEHYEKQWREKVVECRELRKKNGRLRGRVKVLTHEGNILRTEKKRLERLLGRVPCPVTELRYDQLQQQLKTSIARELVWTARAESLRDSIRSSRQDWDWLAPWERTG